MRDPRPACFLRKSRCETPTTCSIVDAAAISVRSESGNNRVTFSLPMLFH
jgi:hypothetical protein